MFSISSLAVSALEMAWLQCLEAMRLQWAATAYTFQLMANVAATLQDATLGAMIGATRVTATSQRNTLSSKARTSGSSLRLVYSDSG